MNTTTPPTLDELRERFGPWTPEQRVPPTLEELALVPKVIRGSRVEIDQIVLPLAPPMEIAPFTIGIVCIAISSIAAIALSSLLAGFRSLIPWFLIHTAWLLPLLVLERRRRQQRHELLLFPSSARCRLRKGPLILESFHDRSLFVPLTRHLGIAPHLGHLLVRKTSADNESKMSVARILNRYILFARGSRAAELGSAPPVPGDLAGWLFGDTVDCLRLDGDALVVRARPTDVWHFGAFFFWSCMYYFGPLLGGAFPRLWALSHGGLLVVASLTIWWYRWEHRPRLITLRGGKREVLVQERNGLQRAFPVEGKVFFPHGEDGSTSLRFVEPNAPNGRRNTYRLAVVPADEATFEHQIALLHAYLGSDTPRHSGGVAPPRSE
jgi:hypothetical protein